MTSVPVFPRLARFKTPESFRRRLEELGLELPVEDALLSARDGSPLAQPIQVYGRTVGNRWCIHPMEGWDGTLDGKPSETTIRRWRHFAISGAKLIFGGEAVAVCHEGRANPNQLTLKPENLGDFSRLLERMRSTHRAEFGSDDDFLVGLQLTHSGRFCKPDPDFQPKPRILYHHPILDRRFGIDPADDSVLLTDAEIDGLIERFITAAQWAAEIGFDFVDVKHCHGYLGHEFLSAHTRPGRYGGSFENRTRFLRSIVEGIRSQSPSLHVAVRVSAFDVVPFHDEEASRQGRQKGIGVPEPFAHCLPYRYGFGLNPDNPLEIDLTEPFQFIELLQSLGIQLVNVTGGSPYYNPHVQRPAYFPPSDGYRPPEDPLVGVVRQIQVTRRIKQRFPRQVIIGTGYTYLQEFLPLVAQGVIRQGWTDLVGIGRCVLSYPQLPADVLQNQPLNLKALCRTFSDCTTAPRHRMISGCYPLDAFYKNRPEAVRLKELKAGE